METIDEEGYTFLEILEHDKVKEKEMKTNLLQKIRLILISKLNGKNKLKAINSWAVAIMRYSGWSARIESSQTKIDR